MAKMRIKRGLKNSVLDAAEREFEPGDQVLVCWERKVENRIRGWLGPFAVNGFDLDRKLSYVRDAKIGAATPYNIAQVKSYIPPKNISRTFLTQRMDSFTSFRSPDGEPIFVTEILDQSDSRVETLEMYESRRKEVKGLIERRTFKVILKEGVPRGANNLLARFVFAIKSTEDRKINYKARYVIGGHRGRLKNLMVHSSQTLSASSTRLLLALALAFSFDV